MKQVQTNTNLATETLVRHDRLPDEARRAFRRTIGHAKSMEQMMWREVAARLTLDAFGITPEAVNIFDGMDKSSYKEYARAVVEARVWFRKRQDSELVFELAGVYDFEIVRNAVMALPPLVEPKNMRIAKPRERRIEHARAA